MFNIFSAFFKKPKKTEMAVVIKEPRDYDYEPDSSRAYGDIIDQLNANTFQREPHEFHAPANIYKTHAMDSKIKAHAMDASLGNKFGFNSSFSTVPAAELGWYASQGFIGTQMSATLAQQAMISKACHLPAKDAVRNGYDVTINDGTKVAPEVMEAIRQADKRYRINKNLQQFLGMGRVFGIRIAMFEVDSPDPDYYFKPFNADGITPGSYKGIVQVDPYWITPELDFDASSNPASQFFYEPTWWRVNARRIHRTHLVIFRTEELPDVLKPTYIYGGVPIPQKIFQRVYAAERTANEAPQLALSKRTTILKTDLTQALANESKFQRRMSLWSRMWNNYGIKTVSEEDDVTQFDTSLADLDTVIMSQYQLVAALANVPATKLLGTAPKGFNATGEFDEASYHEELKSLQTNDLSPLLERHHLLLIRSEIAPQFGIKPFSTEVTWKKLDEPTAKELAELNKLKADTDSVLVMTGAIDGQDVRQRLITDADSGYNGMDSEEIGATGAGDPEYDPDFGENLETNAQSESEDG